MVCGKKALKAAYMNILSVPLFVKLTLLRETGQDQTREDKSRQDRAKQDRTIKDKTRKDRICPHDLCYLLYYQQYTRFSLN